MLCLGILWNSVQEYKNMAISDIKKYGELIGYFDLPLGDNYEKFVRDIYAQDEIASWKVDKKVETMFNSSDTRNITIVFIEVDLTDQFYHGGKKKMVYTNLENLKNGIRGKYSELIKDYFFDNVFHMTDDERELKADLKVLSNYLSKLVKENKQLDDGIQLVKRLKFSDNKNND